MSQGLHRPATMNKSTFVRTFEQSLKNLKTDRIDYLLLHEPRFPITAFDEIFEAATTLKRQGKLRGFGISSFSDRISKTNLADYDSQMDLFQVELPNKALRSEELFRGRKFGHNVFFSPMQALRCDSSTDISSYLRDALEQFPNSIILSSTTNKEHLTTNVSAASN